MRILYAIIARSKPRPDTKGIKTKNYQDYFAKNCVQNHDPIQRGLRPAFYRDINTCTRSKPRPDTKGIKTRCIR